jgi:hypothetical protein
MSKSILLFLATFLFSTLSFAQSKNDVMHLMDGPKEVQIKEVSQHLVKFTYPQESTIYSISKHQIEKIEFASGRVENFESPFKKIKGLENAEDVFVTYNFEEVTGLENVGQLFSKATGVTSLSSMNNVKNRSLDKMKAEAAMIGANVVLIGNASSRGNTYGNQNVPSVSTQTVLFGQAYNSFPSSNEKLIELTVGKRVHHYQVHSLNRNDFGPEMSIATKYDSDRRPVMTEITEATERDGKVFVKIPGFKSKTDALEVIRADETQIVLMEQTNKVIYNYIFITEESDMLKKIPRISGY